MMSKSRKVAIAALCVFMAAIMGSPMAVKAELMFDIHNDEIAHGAVYTTGVIDEIEINEEKQSGIIINDTNYLVASDAILRNQAGSLIALATFAKDQYVEFYVLDDQLITKMWKSSVETIEEKTAANLEGEQENPVQDQQEEVETPQAEKTESGTGKDDIRQEDGVWKN